MRKNHFFKLLCIFGALLVFNFSYSQNPSEDFYGGSGTFNDPYQITNPEQLDNIRKYLGVENAGLHFKVINDIDLSGISWEPISNPSASPSEPAFYGKFNGGGKNIYGMNIGQNGNPTYRHSGLFGLVKTGAVIDSVNLTGGNIKVYEESSSYTGSICGYIDVMEAVGTGTSIVTISNCSSSVNISSNSLRVDEIGGITGRALSYGALDMQVNFLNCNYSGTITSIDNSKVGGILGLSSSFDLGNISLNFINCSNRGNINSSGSTILSGGILGSVFAEGQIAISFEKCYNTGNISGGHGNSFLGGIVAFGSVFGGSRLSILNCYSNSYMIAADNCAGGITGILQIMDDSEIIIEKCYAAGYIDGSPKYAGGLVGRIDNGTTGFIIKDCVAAQKIINSSDIESSVNRIVGENSESTLNNNYANSNMLVKGNIISSSNPDSDSGLDKLYADLQKISSYDSENLNWDINTDGSGLWNIFNEKSLPYFERQSAPAYVTDLFRDSISFELKNNSDSLELIRLDNNAHVNSYDGLERGTFDYAIDLSDMNANNILTLINYEANKEPSYKIYANVQKRNAIIIADDKEKCFGDDDPELTYNLVSQLITGDQLTGQLSREEGEDNGNYEILQGSLNNENYNIIFTPGTFTIKKVDISVTEENNMLIANGENALFQWLDCNNNYSPVENATERLFNPGISGSFAVEVIQYECKDTSECYDLNFISVECDCIIDFETGIYPNPTTGIFYINITEEYGEIKIEIFSYDGKLVGNSEYQNVFNIKCDLTNNPDGLYFIVITNTDGCKKVLKAVKSHN